MARVDLSERTKRFLQKRQERVDSSSVPVEEAARLWARRRNLAFDEIRAALRQMASGLERCMYCEDSAGTAIEHFRPKATHPECTFMWINYLLACSYRNSNEKRGQFPLDATGAPLLIDPSADDPVEHLRLSPTTGIYVDITEKGHTSKEVFRLNRMILQIGRRDAWLTAQWLVEEWGRRFQVGDHFEAEKVMEVLCRQPYAGVRDQLRIVSASPQPELLISQGCLIALQNHPQLLD